MLAGEPAPTASNRAARQQGAFAPLPARQALCPLDLDPDVDVLDELAEKVANVIEKAVDDQCRDLKTLGLSAASEQVGTSHQSNHTPAMSMPSKGAYC